MNLVMKWNSTTKGFPKIGTEVLILYQCGRYLYPDIDTYKGRGRWTNYSPVYWTHIPGETSKAWRTDDPTKAGLTGPCITFLTRLKDGKNVIWVYEGWFDGNDGTWREYRDRVEKWIDLTGCIQPAL